VSKEKEIKKMTNTAIKTKKAPICWDRKNMVTCYDYGDKDVWGKTIWYDQDGKAYELIYARLTKKYSFNRYSKYDKTAAE
jgi:hypothetical protein